MNEIWILGATGRSGRAIATELTGAGLTPVLVGRDTMRLRKVAAAIDRDLRIVRPARLKPLLVRFHEADQPS